MFYPKGEKQKILSLNADKVFNKIKHLLYQSGFAKGTEPVYISTQIYKLTENTHAHTHTHKFISSTGLHDNGG